MAIYNEMEDEIPRALCGDNVRMRLKGIEDEDVVRPLAPSPSKDHR